MKRTGHVARMREMRNVYSIFGFDFLIMLTMKVGCTATIFRVEDMLSEQRAKNKSSLNLFAAS
jgi:hypothetical protein